MKKKILILGSNSFAGTSFVNFLLKKNYKVFSTSRSNEKKNHLIYILIGLTKKTINLKK